jgi:hypothetical protein
MTSVVAILVTLTGFQIAAYFAAANRNYLQNLNALRACDYCSPPYPSTVASSYVGVSAIMITVAVLAILEARLANRRVGI